MPAQVSRIDSLDLRSVEGRQTACENQALSRMWNWPTAPLFSNRRYNPVHAHAYAVMVMRELWLRNMLRLAR